MLPFGMSCQLSKCEVHALQDKTNKVKDEDIEEEVEQKPSDEEAQQAAVEAVQQLTVSQGPAAELPSKPIMGVDQDLSGAALVRKVGMLILCTVFRVLYLSPLPTPTPHQVHQVQGLAKHKFTFLVCCNSVNTEKLCSKLPVTFFFFGIAGD